MACGGDDVILQFSKNKHNEYPRQLWVKKVLLPYSGTADHNNPNARKLISTSWSKKSLPHVSTYCFIKFYTNLHTLET